MNSLRHPLPRPVRPHGSVAVPFAITLPVVLGLMGLAIDLSMAYLRNTHMQQMADSTAMAAARELNGTLAGVTAAKTQATKMAESNYYDGIFKTASSGQTYFDRASSWTTGALFLSSSPNGAWVAADDVTDATTAATLLYAKVDTSVLNSMSAAPGRVTTTFTRLLGAPDSVVAQPVSIAGAVGLQITPLGICALKTAKFTSHPLYPPSPTTSELVEFGYRRGVTYDLLRLNPSGASAQNFLVNPIDGPDVVNPSSQHYTHDFIKPFFCSGTIAYANLRHDQPVHVAPMNGIAIHEWLNSRFNVYSGDACTPNGAPPDKITTEFLPGATSWMTTTAPVVNTYQTGAALLTIANPDTVPPNVATGDYGPLWIYKRPVKFVSSTLGGGASPIEFARTDWSKLYYATSGSQFPLASSFTPAYNVTAGSSSSMVFPKRRLLNVPLLDCSGTIGNSATVLGIGTFLMSSKATSSTLYAEFEGLADEASLASSVRRLQ